jgi:tetratricopeptide (TPR) repeat protein
VLNIGSRGRLIPVAALFAACSLVRGSEEEPEAISLLGKQLYAPAATEPCDCSLGLGTSSREQFVDSLIAMGQRMSRAWRFRDAVTMYTRGIDLTPDEPRLYRHRGHRFITLRRFSDAVADLDRAHALDSTSFDIEYHRGLAYYLSGRFSDAANIYARCMAQGDLRTMAVEDTIPASPRLCADVAIDDDARVAMTDWRYRALRRAGRNQEASILLATIAEGMRVRENLSYYANLRRYAGRITEDRVLAEAAGDSVRFATSGYAMANWHLIEGDSAGGRTLLDRVAESPHWPGFGVIAAEAEIVRLAPARRRGGR